MYNVSVMNGSQYTMQASDGATVPPGATWTTQQGIGNAWIRSDQLGAINFLDIADQHIPGDSGETWGVLISYQGEEVVGRYEGGGQLNVTVNNFGQAELSGMDLRQVQLSSFTFALS
ncbi:MAG: hypothetical protein QOH76_847 [Thermoleophilaceae bacterium]|nr:hypothetical protein [Thermoleophilaceae bacterium]